MNNTLHANTGVMQTMHSGLSVTAKAQNMYHKKSASKSPETEKKKFGLGGD